MSPSNINSFVGDLVQMATAFENLPKVEQERDQLKAMNDEQGRVIASREEAIQRYKQEIESLNSRIRSLEVERDDASFRVLEVEERTEKLERSFESALEAMDATDRLIQSFKPVLMPEPAKEPEPVATPTKGQSVLDPTTNANAGEGKSEQTSVTSSANEVATSVPEAVSSISELSGQSESSPTAKEEGISSETVSSQSASTTASADTTAGSAEPTHGPYFGKRYRDVIGYVSHQDWINGGGTEGDYGGRGW